MNNRAIIIAENRSDLIELIKGEINQYGNECDLFHIDVSKLKNMSFVFNLGKEIRYFNGNISNWDVSNVENMDFMFMYSKFNGDISKWNVSNVISMKSTFTKSEFNQNIGSWNVSKVQDMNNMFSESIFKKNLTDWKPIELKSKVDIFKICPAIVPYWAEAENTPAAVRSYWLNKDLESNLVDKKLKNNKIKV